MKKLVLLLLPFWLMSCGEDSGTEGYGTDSGTGGYGTDSGTGGSGTDSGTGGYGTDSGTGGSDTDSGTEGYGTDSGTGGYGTDSGTGGSDTDSGTGGSDTDSGTGGSDTDSGTGGSDGEAGSGYVVTGDWHGCAWTGKDDLVQGQQVEADWLSSGYDILETETTVSPLDFMNKAADENFCISGAVGDSHEAVALLGFNINEDKATADCSYDPNAVSSSGPPTVAIQESGIAVNIASNVTSATIRIQIQTENGNTNENERWCFDLEVTGAGAADGVKRFAKYSDFNTKCWDDSGEAYANQPISAVVFLVPGGVSSTTPYEFCVLGFAEGNSAADAPEGFAVNLTQEGTVGGQGESHNYERALVTIDSREYIIQNNYWGATSGYQVLDFVDNSFTISHFSGHSTGGGVPVSFPSIYVGQNGSKTLTTTNTDNLPARISSITRADTMIRWSGSGLDDSNAAYDIWFSNDNPPYGGQIYGDAVSGFAMLWLRKPGGRQPIGGSPVATANFCGHTWDVWAGPRGSSPEYPNLDANRPVISYVVQGSDVTNFTCDLKEMMNDATTNNYNGYSLNSSWYLTDVFFGFEIWGGYPVGSSVDEFTINVQTN